MRLQDYLVLASLILAVVGVPLVCGFVVINS